MRFEHEGMTLWYGMPDTPAPEGAVLVGSDIAVTIAVKPADASNKVELLYRRDQGTVETVTAKWLRHDLSHNAQYFKARFPVFRVGDTVEYTVICGCAGRQVPHTEEAKQFPSSFHVVAAESQHTPTPSTVQEAAVLRAESANASSPRGIASTLNISQPGETVPASLPPPLGGVVVPPPPRPGGTIVPPEPPPTKGGSGTPQSVTGQIFLDHGLPASGLSLRLYNRGFGGADILLGQTSTDSKGLYAFSYSNNGKALNLDVRAVGPDGKEVQLANTQYNVGQQVTLNLVAPASLQPLAPEYQRLTSDLSQHLTALNQLGGAREDEERQDLTLLCQATGWDARLLALAASAASLAQTTGMGQDVLYALLRAGLPTDLQKLALVSPTAIGKALGKASQSGIVSLNDEQISAATAAFQNFASKTRLTVTAAGANSTFGDLLSKSGLNANQQNAFADLYFSESVTADGFWQQVSALDIPVETLNTLKLQGKLSYLTFNNANLVQSLQKELGSLDNLSRLPEKDFHNNTAWKNYLTSMVGPNNTQMLDKLIPPAYQGETTADRLEAYAADLARKVRLSFPTQVVSRMIDTQQLPVDQASAGNVSAFLKAAAPLGYELGRTPLHAFLKTRSQGVPALDAASTESLKTVHRLYQVTPSTESLNVVLNLGFKSAYDIASHTKEEFMYIYGGAFPSPGEASLVYGKAQQISSVTFNFFSMAKQLDTAPLVYGMSASDDGRQHARNAIVQQFPTMESLFGSMDFCDCEECRSVLSPAAYFVDLLEFLRQSAPNPAGYTPLDVLIGKDQTVPGRRPDLAALPLTCENTNTAMPYIDLVNEILEYYIANNGLDGKAAYDTGSATTADLTAEPQHILPKVYSDNLKKAVYPLSLPFDLWIETVRGFFNYFKTPLAQVLDVLRPADQLELFSDGNAYPYYRAQIFAESLGLSPAEYGVLTVLDPLSKNPTVQNWYQLYGYLDENTALNGKVDPTDVNRYLIPPLKSAKNLAQRLGLSYEDLTGLVSTGFLNPALNALIFQFERFGISMRDAFSYTGQPGYTALSGQAKTAFEALLDGITQHYTQQNQSSTFDARTWLANILPANYSQQVLVLRDPDTGCNFTETTLQYADGTAAKPLDFLKLGVFVRLWKKLGWTLDETDRALQLFFPSGLPSWTDPNFPPAFNSAWKTALVYLAHLNDLATQLNPALGRVGLLPLWTDLPTQGTDPLYAQLFLTPGVLNNDSAFDDPSGQFPWSTSDPLSTHQAALQGALGLTSDELAAILNDAASAVTTVPVVVNGQNVSVPGFSLANISICYRYSVLAKCLQLPVSDLIALKAISGLNPFQTLSGNPLAALADDILFSQTLAFVKQVGVVQGSGFTVEDLKYLLRHQFDPVGKYQRDFNALTAVVRSVANGLRQIQAQNAVPSDLTGLSADLIEQKLSSLFPAQILKALFALLTNRQTYQASQGGVVPAGQIDATPFAAATELNFSYDSTTQTQTLAYKGVLLDGRKAALLQINNSPLFTGLLNGVQQQAQASFNRSVEDILGVWASQAEYEAVQSGVATALAADPLTQKDPAISLSYDQADQLQWLAYRGVLTDAKEAALTTGNPPPVLSTLLNDVQQQAMPAYRELLGTLLAMWANIQTYEAGQSGVAPVGQIDPTVFAAHPEVHLSYDATAQVQMLTYQGVMTDARRIQLAGLIPASTALANLLQSARNQAVQFFQAQAANLLAVTAADLDSFTQPFLGIDDSTKQKRVKEELLKVFLPLVAQKLSRQLILQTLSANLASDPSLTGALLIDAGLLTDPNNPGKSLLGSFLAVGQAGASAAYHASADASGPSLATGTAATTDTADPTNPNANKPGTGSAHFEGYLEVPTDGPYRFFAELGNQSARVTFQVDSPDPAALFKNPIVQQQAAKDNDEASQFVQLRGGVPYHFTLDFANLGANGASLLIQGENLPKGPLSQIVLYPQTAVDGFIRAQVLLSKVLQVLQSFGLDEREVSYLTANAAQFNNLKLSALPTQASDDSPAQAVTLFSQFLTLADYADLRKGPAGASDGLVDVFENVGQTFSEPAPSQDSNQDLDTPWRRLANLTRRDPQVVRDVVRFLGLFQEQMVGPIRQVKATGDFGNNKGIRRIWQVLQLVQVAGIPVASLTASTLIASLAPPLGSPAPEEIAANLKNAVKAGVPPESWRPMGQLVFDALRRKKRDALVAYLVNALGLENAEQLFEYFLVDPGMEPVVRTSRLRLALSSVQTFIQRCLLNLENGNTGHPERNVSPAAIEADWWAWMKRYRVWQANREIFLFPENWMVPELRLDKTDLFQALESALLQGDVTRDLVEEAFLTYLKGLDVRARLDVVAMYLDQDTTHPGLSTLHVIARTYGRPHKYFYRTYSNQSWSAWEAVTPDIEGDHIVAVVWRGRLNLFWVTFVKKARAAAPPRGSGDTTPVVNLSFSELAGRVYGAAAPPRVEVQLNWSEYFQGKWSDRISTDSSRYPPMSNIDDNFDPDFHVYVHVSKEVDANGNEAAVKIHLDLQGYDEFYAFRVTSKNCDPDFRAQYWEPAPPMPYNTSGVDATLYTGSSLLQATFETQITAAGDGTPDTEQILKTVNNYALLTCANPVTPPFLDPSEPRYQEAGGLVSPFFYKDISHPNTRSEFTFFVQPSLTESTLLEWVGWAIPPAEPDPHLVDKINQIHVIAQVPVAGPIPVNPGDPVHSVYPMQSLVDWATNPATAISYGDTWIGPGGAISAGKISTFTGAANVPPAGAGVLAGAGVAGGLVSRGLMLVGSQGVSLNQLRTIQAAQDATGVPTFGAAFNRSAQ